MSDLSFVAGEFTGLAATSREAAEAVRSARPEGGGSAFASAMPGTSLSSQMQGAEEKIADRGMDNAKGLDEAADSLELSERDFIAAEEENGQLVGSIMSEQGDVSNALGHSYGSVRLGSSPADDGRLYDSPGTGGSRVLRPGVPDGRETLEDPNDVPVDLYGGGGGVQAQPYTGGAKVEANPFHEELGGTVNL